MNAKRFQISLPFIGFERNEPLRRVWSRMEVEPVIERLDPVVTYHFREGCLVRPAGVEAWIESCSARYPGKATRDLWEEVWNLAMCAWNAVDRFGVEPWSPPVSGFPWTVPAFWQGFSRNRRLFVPTPLAVEKIGVVRGSGLERLVRSIVRFAYGLDWEEVPFGMACIALNAPSEAYRIRQTPLATATGAVAAADEAIRGWAFPFQAGPRLKEDPSSVHHLLELESSLESLVLVLEEADRGMGFFRSEGKDPEGEASLQAVIEKCVGRDWGGLEEPPCLLEDEALWPWLGPVRSAIRNPEK
jgi:hypothetical protein